MPITPRWYDDEHTIVLIEIPADGTWDEYYQTVDWIVTEVEQVEHRVDLIFHEHVGMPKGNPIPHLKWGSQRMYSLSNMGHTFIAGNNKKYNMFTKMVMDTVVKYFTGSSTDLDTSRQLYFVPNLEAALKAIHDKRADSNMIFE